MNTCNFQIQLMLEPFQLQHPNECDTNFVDIFGDQTDEPSRIKQFCGSIADTVVISTNIAHLRFYAEPKALNSTFEAVMTAYRDKGTEKREFIQITNYIITNIFSESMIMFKE